MLSVNIKNEELRIRLKVFCAAHGLKIFQVVSDAIEQYLDNNESK